MFWKTGLSSLFVLGVACAVENWRTNRAYDNAMAYAERVRKARLIPQIYDEPS